MKRLGTLYYNHHTLAIGMDAYRHRDICTQNRGGKDHFHKDLSKAEDKYQKVFKRLGIDN